MQVLFQISNYDWINLSALCLTGTWKALDVNVHIHSAWCSLAPFKPRGRFTPREGRQLCSLALNCILRIWERLVKWCTAIAHPSDTLATPLLWPALHTLWVVLAFQTAKWRKGWCHWPSLKPSIRHSTTGVSTRVYTSQGQCRLQVVFGSIYMIQLLKMSCLKSWGKKLWYSLDFWSLFYCLSQREVSNLFDGKVWILYSSVVHGLGL